ncbi:hypothetical protein G1K75_12365 [Tenacibaculum finnmarkense]|uniref:hypothetical protein n=1 Tax=Tenacibaculum finnmarkense TaxID=2781243 RepID=UPI001EFA5CB5|nr:hypothetical protein [Tenacibaculum finnmarkense]MCG8806445.1 hypothetical protein [Tenacibaculum finnmarkense]MCG8857564.1 hypothetical protein [Tenacibaculum finnmarkense]
MTTEINETVLCILKYKEDKIVIDYKPIEQNFIKEITELQKLLNSNQDTITQIINFINQTNTLKQLQQHYKYCKELDVSYQGFRVNFEEKTKELKDRKDLIYFNQKQNPENYDFDNEIEQLKIELKSDFELWTKAFDIGKAYRKCYEDKSILTFSHRINGWSNPEYQLSPNFSIELKTNFGYGNSSYFYIKIRYKNIDITPVSEWIDYEIANFSEIVRYTKSFSVKWVRGTYNGRTIFRKEIKNPYWKNAMEFAMIACNCSRRSETEFIEKYVIEECENMVSGLTNIASNSIFSFIGENNTHYKVDKKGHQLIEFRGEKISGAIDFISKIVEYNKIAEIQKFITNIEQINKEIKPILIEEIKIIELKLNRLNKDLSVIKPEYVKLNSKNIEYNKNLNKLRIEMINNKTLDYENVDYKKLMQQFNQLNPEYRKFVSEFEKVRAEYNELIEKINILVKLKANIKSYHLKIENYFKK